eukprot:TRINITY_DN26988_c1_g7_i1.p1 TRINITY_DN26988_c1_g7~~TRINITY_DN26988_c1_g7_i1.p1  ORF type:complete len:835 (+),score=57.34 TRINITY_DN26988_c1_g7_i1:81-2585(+)
MGVLSMLGLRKPPEIVVLDCLAEGGPRHVATNVAEPVQLSSEFFEGRVVISHRPGGSHSRAVAAAARDGAPTPRWRGCEIQIQGTLLRAPKPGYGLFWTAELGPFDHAAGAQLQMQGLFGRLKARTALAALRRGSRRAGLSGCRFSYGSPCIRTHAAVDMQSIGNAFDNVTVWTPLAAEPPPLGAAFHTWAASHTSIKRLLEPKASVTDSIFTASLQTNNLDLPRWQVNPAKMIGLKLKRLIGKHPLHLALIEAPLGEWTDLRDFTYMIDLAVLNTRVHREILWRTPVGITPVSEESLYLLLVPAMLVFVSFATFLLGVSQVCPYFPDLLVCREAMASAEMLAVALAQQAPGPMEAIVYLACAFMAFLVCLLAVGACAWRSSAQPRLAQSFSRPRLATQRTIKALTKKASCVARDASTSNRRDFESEVNGWEYYHSFVATAYGYPAKAPTRESLRRSIEACQELLGSDLEHESQPLGALSEPIDDVFWGRLLLARDFDVRLAVDAASKYLSWRADGGGCGTPNLDLFTGTLFPACTGVEGQPVIAFRARYHSAKQPVEVTRAAYITFMDAIIARHLGMRSQAGLPANVLEQFTVLVDLEGCGKANWDFPGIKVMLEESNQHYPDMLRNILVVNVSSFFAGLWRMVSPTLHPRTRNKVVFVSKKNTKELLKHISADQLPISLGGTAKEWPAPEDMNLDERLGILGDVLKTAAANAHPGDLVTASHVAPTHAQWQVRTMQRAGGVLLLEVCRAGGPPEAVRLCTPEDLRALANALGLPAPNGDDAVGCFSCNSIRSAMTQPRKQWEVWLNQVLESPEVLKRSDLRRRLATFLQIKL